MYENKFDQAVDEISILLGANWTDDSKIRVMARFLAQRHPELLQEFEGFVHREAEAELGDAADRERLLGNEVRRG